MKVNSTESNGASDKPETGPARNRNGAPAEPQAGESANDLSGQAAADGPRAPKGSVEQESPLDKSLAEQLKHVRELAKALDGRFGWSAATAIGAVLLVVANWHLPATPHDPNVRADRFGFIVFSAFGIVSACLSLFFVGVGMIQYRLPWSKKWRQKWHSDTWLWPQAAADYKDAEKFADAILSRGTEDLHKDKAREIWRTSYQIELREQALFGSRVAAVFAWIMIGGAILYVVALTHALQIPHIG